MEGRASRGRGRRVREHQRRGQGRVRPVLHLGQRGADRGVPPGGPGGAVPARPVPRRLRPAGHRPRQPARLARRMPRARRDQPGRAAPQGGRRARRPSCSSTRSAAARPPRCGRRARATCRPAAPGCCPPGACSTPPAPPRRRTVLVATETGMLHQLRQANPAVRWEPVNPDAVCRLYEDDDAGRPAALPARGGGGGARRSRRGRPGPAGRPGHDRGGVAVGGQRAGRRESPGRSGAAGDRRGAAPPALLAAALGTRRRRGGRGLRGRGHDRRAGRRRSRPPGAAGQQGRRSAGAPRRWPRAAWPPRSARGTPRPCTSGTRSTRAPACATRRRWRRWSPRRPARSPGWPRAGPGWSAPRCTWRAGTAAAGSCTPGATRSARRCTGCSAAALLASRVQVLTRCVALDALTGDRGAVGGVLAGMAGARTAVLQVGHGDAPRAVVLATGGFGQAYATTTNPAGLTGDGLALAARAGAELRDVEFVQFHPTVLWQDGGPRPVPADHRGPARRRGGAGGRGGPAGHGRAPSARRPGPAGRRVGGHAAADGSTGDGPDDHLWLDATALGRAVLERDFPTVAAAVPGPRDRPGGRADPGRARRALRLRRHPGRHGRADLGARAVRGGGGRLHRGARRQPARLQLPDRGPDHRPARRGPARRGSLPGAGRPGCGCLRARPGGEPRRPGRPWPRPCPGTPGCSATARAWNGLRQTLDQARPAAGRLDLATAEATSLHVVSVLVATAALARAESRGCHRWRDAPAAVAGRPGPGTRCSARTTGQRWAAGAVQAGVGAGA